MTREAMLQRFAEAGLGEQFVPLDAATGQLLVTWLTPLLREHETIEQLQEAGARWIYGDDPGSTRAHLKEYRDRLGERVCVLWPLDAFAAEMSLDAFADHFDDLWYPAAEDVWLLSFDHRRFLTINHEELVLYGDLGGPARWPVWRPRPRE